MINLFRVNKRFYLACIDLLDIRMDLLRIIYLADCNQIIENYKDLYCKYVSGVKCEN